MMKPRFLLLCVMLIHFAYEAQAMHCDMGYGLALDCPTAFNKEDELFCCQGDIMKLYCCNIQDYAKQNAAVLAGIVVGIIVILLVCTLCCCCFCSCCLLAKRRTNRGRVLYAPVAPPPVDPSVSVLPPAYSPSSYPMQSATIVHAPPPSYPVGSQPPINPHYKG